MKSLRGEEGERALTHLKYSPPWLAFVKKDILKQEEAKARDFNESYSRSILRWVGEGLFNVNSGHTVLCELLQVI